MKRRGMSILEVMVAAVLLATVMSMCVQTLALSAGQRRAAQDRQRALQEAANQMERLAVLPWAELTPQGVAAMKVSGETARSLPAAKVEIEIEPADDDPEAKRVAVVVHWQGRDDRPAQRLRLVAWRYRR